MEETKSKKPGSTKPREASESEKLKKASTTKVTPQAAPAEQPQKVASSDKLQKAEVATKAKRAMINIKQIGSPIRRDPRQGLYLKSLGLGKLNRTRQVVDTPSTRGLLDKLRHMVVVVEQ